MTILCARCRAEIGDTRRPLTAKQRAVHEFVASFIGSKGYAPSLAEICAHFGYRSEASAHEHLTSLVRRGWIQREYNGERAITLVEQPYPLRAETVHTA